MKRNVFLRIAALVVTVVLFVSVAVPMNVWGAGKDSLMSFINDPRWANGAAWGGSKRPLISPFSSAGCCAYCADYVKYCYGINNPRSGTPYYNVNEVRAGDVVTLGNQSDGTGHWFVVIERNGNSCYVAEGNGPNDRVRIGWNYTISGNRFSNDARAFNTGYHFLAEEATQDPDVAAFNASKTPVGRYLCVNSTDAKMYLTPNTAGNVASRNVNDAVISVIPQYITVYADYVGTNRNGVRFYHMANNDGLMCDQIGGVYMEASKISELPASGEFAISSQLIVNLNIRATASSTGTRIALAAPGSKVFVNSISGKWANVNYQGQTGYCMVGYLDFHPIHYTVTWKIDGKTEKESLAYGTVPSHSVPKKESDGRYMYLFSGWSPEIGMVTGDVTYTAVFEKEPLVVSGDINGDGNINAMDCLLLKGYILKTFKNADADQIGRMNLNGDNAINAVDYALLRAAVLGTKKF